jgi:hypothetical protein
MRGLPLLNPIITPIVTPVVLGTPPSVSPMDRRASLQ